MRFIQDQIDLAVEAIRLEKPVIKLVPGYYRDIAISLNNKLAFDPELSAKVDRVVLEAVRGRTSVKLNLDSKKYVSKVDTSDVIGTVLYSVGNDILEFLRDNGGFANNRLSKNYKWYKDKIDNNSLRQNEKFAHDLFNLTKFIRSSRSEKTIEAARTLLTLIKDRYEPTLGGTPEKSTSKKKRRRW